MSAALATRIAEDFAATAPASHEQQRQRAMQALTKSGLPTSRDENWKYVNLRPLEKVRFAPAAGESTDRRLRGFAGNRRPSRYTFVDGVFAPALSAPTTNEGVSVISMKASPPRAAGVSPDLPADLRFALLNEAFATDGAQIEVAPGAHCETCIELVFVATTEAKSGASYPRVSFKVGAGARIGLIERHVSIGSDANFINCAVDVEVARDASVQHYPSPADRRARDLV